MFPTRFVRLAEARARFGDRVDRLGVYLTRADPLADAVVEAIEAMPPGAGSAVFDRIARQGLDAARDAPEAMQTFFAAVGKVPAWVDWETLDRGGQVLLRAGPLGGFVLAFKSLVLAYTSPAGNKPLVFSGRLAQSAPRRLHETSRFVRSVIWPGGLRPGAEGWRATLKVRLMHARLRRMILRSGRWDEAAWGVPINQHDEAATAVLFSAAVLEGLRRFGLRVRSSEAEAYMHLWRWSGWLMGVDPNLAPVTEGEANRLVDLIAATQAPPDDDSRALTRVLFESAGSGAPTGAQTAAERMHVSFVAALCRMLIGDEMADELAVPRSRWRPLRYGLRRVVSVLDRIRDAAPLADEPAIRMGMTYWNRVTAEPRSVPDPPFALPERLASHLPGNVVRPTGGP